MSKRSRPRAITCSVTGNGNTVASPCPSLPVISSASSLRWPRATVLATIGRADCPSTKKSDERSPRYFGWSCMSWRQAATVSRSADAPSSRPRRPCRSWFTIDNLFRNRGHLVGTERGHERAGALEIELAIARFDAEEEAVAARHREARVVEDRVIRLRQLVQHDHAEHAGQRRAQDRALEGDRDEHRPADERLA